jgi:hypothetical protein
MPHLIDDVDVADGQAQVVQADIDDWTSRRGTGRRDAAATGQQGWMPMLNAAEWRRCSDWAARLDAAEWSVIETLQRHGRTAMDIAADRRQLGAGSDVPTGQHDAETQLLLAGRVADLLLASALAC